MKEKLTLEEIVKKNINKKEFKYSEQLWEKLDTQLVPVRAAYQKKEKRKLLVILSLLFITGATIALLLQIKNKSEHTSNIPVPGKNDPTIQNIPEKNNKAAINANPALDPLSVSNTPPATNNKTAINAPDIALNNNKALPVNTDNNNGIGNVENRKSILPQNTIGKHSNNPEFLAKKKAKPNAKNKNRDQKKIFLETPGNEITIVEEESPKKEGVELQGKNTEKDIIKQSEENKTIPEQKNLPLEKNIAPATENKEQKNTKKSKTSIIVTAGTNISSSLKQPGYYAGIMLEKKIDDKQIFVGLKLAYNSLDHQLISASKANVFPQITDAVIDRLTTIQIPFGYSFNLNKKAGARSPLLHLGFEPTLLTGIRTIYYDDNGVPNGPRTPVVNSPLLKNAINRFNLSFIAGVQFGITEKIGGSVNGGYGLINITDKQYYNRNNKNNNLKYLQAGLTFKLK